MKEIVRYKEAWKVLDKYGEYSMTEFSLKQYWVSNKYLVFRHYGMPKYDIPISEENWAKAITSHMSVDKNTLELAEVTNVSITHYDEPTTVYKRLLVSPNRVTYLNEVFLNIFNLNEVDVYLHVTSGFVSAVYFYTKNSNDIQGLACPLKMDREAQVRLRSHLDLVDKILPPKPKEVKEVEIVQNDVFEVHVDQDLNCKNYITYHKRTVLKVQELECGEWLIDNEIVMHPNDVKPYVTPMVAFIQQSQLKLRKFRDMLLRKNGWVALDDVVDDDLPF